MRFIYSVLAQFWFRMSWRIICDLPTLHSSSKVCQIWLFSAMLTELLIKTCSNLDFCCCVQLCFNFSVLAVLPSERLQGLFRHAGVAGVDVVMLTQLTHF